MLSSAPHSSILMSTVVNKNTFDKLFHGLEMNSRYYLMVYWFIAVDHNTFQLLSYGL